MENIDRLEPQPMPGGGGPLARRTVVLGVSGSIAAYKAVEVLRLLTKAGADVHVVMTANATRFVAPLTFQVLSGHRIVTSTWDEPEPAPAAAPASDDAGVPWSPVGHIDLAQQADVVVLAPATANVIGKYAHGIADDALSTLLLAVRCPVLVAPAMNTAMYEHPAVRANCDILAARGVQFIEPGAGELACRTVGTGRLAEPDAIAGAVCALYAEPPLTHPEFTPLSSATEPVTPMSVLWRDLDGPLANPGRDEDDAPVASASARVVPHESVLAGAIARAVAEAHAGDEAAPRETDEGPSPLIGRTVVISAGRTEEPIDPVRVLTNRSSGKMGVALAEAARERGARVVLVAGAMSVSPPSGIEVRPALTADAMAAAVHDAARDADVVIMAAAVSDYRVAEPSAEKLARVGSGMTLELESTDDILASLGRDKGDTLLVGFALETGREGADLARAREKMLRKNCDMVVLNNAVAHEETIGGDTNAVTLLTADGTVEQLPVMPKMSVARHIVARIEAMIENADDAPSSPSR